MTMAIAAGILGTIGTAGLRADDDEEKQKIDCSDTDLGFSATGYDVTCTDLSKGTINVDEVLAGVRAHKLVAESHAEATFLVVIDNRPLGNRIYLGRHSLEDDVQNYFSGGAFSDWAPGTSVGQFEVENFTGEMKDGAVLECIAFRHQGARRYEGLARLVVGLACSARGREHDYDALKHLDAPSG
ncbi:MAG TPA: hypothetical protein VHA35_12890 [Dongiaceae bacterium]|nr:hypothetical protein [Dongiaceae bacterium]